MDIRISDFVRYATVRILTSQDENANWTGCGTGFFYAFDKGEKVAPVLVTNKHVLDGATFIGLKFHEADENYNPKPGPGCFFYFPVGAFATLRHPNPDVDLAAIELSGIIQNMRATGNNPFIKCLAAENLPTDNILSDIGAISEFIMVGYPTGIADEYNNFPIVRRGVTATPYISSYRGKHEFLMDIAVFGGSSGSPVFILNEGAVSTNKGLAFGTRFALMGILYAGHTQTFDGQIRVVDIPNALVPVAQTSLMINLGICVKSDLIEQMSYQINW